MSSSSTLPGNESPYKRAFTCRVQRLDLSFAGITSWHPRLALSGKTDGIALSAACGQRGYSAWSEERLQPVRERTPEPEPEPEPALQPNFYSGPAFLDKYPNRLAARRGTLHVTCVCVHAPAHAGAACTGYACACLPDKWCPPFLALPAFDMMHGHA
jgi:hypothetical protein